MFKRAAFSALILVAACSDGVGPARDLSTPQFATTPGSGIVLDQQSGGMGQYDVHIGKGFDPVNPHLGDAIVATFFWFGSANTIQEVTDHLANGTPVGNHYTLVEYVTAGGFSMATYVATNVQGFPEPNTDPFQGDILAVGAYLSQPVTDGGVAISAWTGVNTVAAQSLGAHRAASGLGSGITPAGPGSISIGAG